MFLSAVGAAATCVWGCGVQMEWCTLQSLQRCLQAFVCYPLGGGGSDLSVCFSAERVEQSRASESRMQAQLAEHKQMSARAHEDAARLNTRIEALSLSVGELRVSTARTDPSRASLLFFVEARRAFLFSRTCHVTVRCTPHASRLAPCALCCVLCVVCCALCAVRCVLCAVRCVLCVVCCVLCVVWAYRLSNQGSNEALTLRNQDLLRQLDDLRKQHLNASESASKESSKR